MGSTCFVMYKDLGYLCGVVFAGDVKDTIADTVYIVHVFRVIFQEGLKQFVVVLP